MINDKKLYEFCKDNYYCDAEEDGEERCLWEPFEHCSSDQVEGYILNDVLSLKAFLRHNLNKEWDDTNNN